MKKSILFSVFTILASLSFSQQQRWQQEVKYTMTIDVDTATNRFAGKQRLVYKNNSNEKLDKVYYHLYWNAFQPNSSMDMRSRELGKKEVNGRPDWDGRVKDRILNLKEDEIGYQKIISLKMNGLPQSFIYHETILEVKLSKPILPNTSVIFDMDFEAQVPLQVRRSGRDNPSTGVRYSMSQWYPKLCEFDEEGWHPTPYVAREFYGVWGDFDVTINIASNYKLGGTGVLLNAAEIGWGYDKPGTGLLPCKTAKRSWHFKGDKIHDFVWAADPDYEHLVRKSASGLALHVIYNKKTGTNEEDWNKVADAAVKVLPFIEKNFGKYPYPQYSFIQGGDGGMEYPMATLVSGPSLGTAFHEWMHSWYQMMLGSNEGQFAWMDEGFTSFAEDLVTRFYNNNVPAIKEYEDALAKNPNNERLKDMLAAMPEDHSGAYASYFSLAKSGLEESMCTHADHYNTNFAYSVDAYSKGEVFLEQLGYVIGAAARNKALLDYYNQWKFKHPNPNDFIRIAEKASGIQLDWYRQYWVHSIKTIDYGIDSLWEEGGQTLIRLKRSGLMPMPIDVKITFKEGGSEMYQIPLNLMFGSKQPETQDKTIVAEFWKWTHPLYVLKIGKRLTDINRVEIDPSKRMADINRKNNLLELKW